MKKSILIACLGLVSLGLQAQSISLAGEWNVELGKSGSAFAKSKRASQGEVKRAILPGTIDTNHLGFAPKDTMETTHLTRLYAYKGAARYSRTINIPKDWKKKPVELFLERTRPTWVYVDGELVDSCNFISIPQRYLLPKNYYYHDDPNEEPLVTWRAHANLFYSNWINYYVYQETPYNIDEIS